LNAAYPLRVGLEDNLYFGKSKESLTTNVALVDRIVKLATLFERPIATPRMARQMLNLPCR
jgi:uncharacterized protein (DUF849 family)